MQRHYALIISWNTRNSILFSMLESHVLARNFLFLFFLSRSEAHFFLIWSFWVAQKHIFSPFGLSESLRSAFFLHLVFLSRSEAWFFSIWPFWVTQKRIFSPFNLSESLRSAFFLHLAFLSHSEAHFFSIWPFWVTQKLDTTLFGFRLCNSMKNKALRRAF